MTYPIYFTIPHSFLDAEEAEGFAECGCRWCSHAAGTSREAWDCRQTVVSDLKVCMQGMNVVPLIEHQMKQGHRRNMSSLTIFSVSAHLDLEFGQG